MDLGKLMNLAGNGHPLLFHHPKLGERGPTEAKLAEKTAALIATVDFGGLSRIHPFSACETI